MFQQKTIEGGRDEDDSVGRVITKVDTLSRDGDDWSGL